MTTLPCRHLLLAPTSAARRYCERCRIDRGLPPPPVTPTPRPAEDRPGCPACGHPLDGAAAGLAEHHDCRGRRERQAQLAELTRRVRELARDGTDLDGISRATRVGKATIQKLLDRGGR